MAKLRSADTLSLDKTKQKKVAQQTNKLKKKIQEQKITVKVQKKSTKVDVAESRGLVYIAHIPHGFYEIEMKNYFQQFGAVTNVKVCRSRKNGNSKGYGYVEFSHPDVAKIAAETMNNYLMFKKRIIAEYVPYEKRPKSLFKGVSSNPKRYSSKIRREKQISANLEVAAQKHLKRSNTRLSKLNKKIKRLQKAGIDYDIKPVDTPANIKQEKYSDENITHTYQPDPYDSDIEVKIPLKRSKKSITMQKKPKKEDSSDKTSLASKLFVAKSLDSVKALLSSNKATDLKVKNRKAASVDILKKKKKEKVGPARGIKKKNFKVNTLNSDTIKKIARELIRKQGDSLLNITTVKKKLPQKIAQM